MGTNVFHYCHVFFYFFNFGNNNNNIRGNQKANKHPLCLLSAREKKKTIFLKN